MSDIRFYHLLTTPELQALPQIALKAWQAGQRMVIRGSDAARISALNDALWTFRADVFLPHGSIDDGYAAEQPIWLTDGIDNPNQARTLLMMSGCTPENIDGYDLCCFFLDGRDDAQISDARVYWKTLKEAGHTLSYWQQTDSGWEKKA